MVYDYDDEKMMMGMDIYDTMRFRPDKRNHFVDPQRNRHKNTHPYSYDPYWIWKKGDVKVKGVNVDYHDRLQQWNWDRYRKAFDLVKEDGCTGDINSFTQEQASMFMSHYQDKPCEVIAIAEGCNQSSGYPYWVFWYVKK